MNRSLATIVNDTSLDDTNDTLTVSKNMCATKREQDGAVRRVTFNDTIDYGTTVAYSTTNGAPPKLVVATANGTTKSISATADHYTGKRAEVMRARIKAHAPKRFHPHRRRTFILQAFLSRAGQRAGGKRGPTTG